MEQVPSNSIELWKTLVPIIKEGLSQYEHLLKLREFTRSQMKSLIDNPSLKTLT